MSLFVRLHFRLFINFILLTLFNFRLMLKMFQFLVIVYNSMAHPRKSYVRLPVAAEGYAIRQLSRRKRSVVAQVNITSVVLTLRLLCVISPLPGPSCMLIFSFCQKYIPPVAQTCCCLHLKFYI